MAFEPQYQEAAESEIVSNFIAVIKRDMPDALTHFYSEDNLPTFAIVTDGEISEFRFPLFVLGVQRMTSTESLELDEGGYLSQSIILSAGMALASTSLKIVRLNARKYVRCIKSVIRSTSVSDLLPATALILNHSIDIDHRYFKHRKDEIGNTVQEVEFDFKISFGES